MIRPTTGTEAGLAQAFDTSMIYKTLAEEKERKKKEFEKNYKQFDPSTVWYRDLPEFSRMVKNYNNFLAENYDALSDKMNNLETWQEVRNMETELLNFVAGSKQMEQMVNRAQNLTFSNPKYDTKENQDLLAGIISGSGYEGGLVGGYESGEAHNSSFMNQFNKNIYLDTSQMTKTLRGIGTPDIKGIESVSKDGKTAMIVPISYDEDKIDEFVAEWWEKGDGENTSRDIQQKYGDIISFKESVMRGLPEYGDEKILSQPSEGKDGKPTVFQWNAEQRDVQLTTTSSEVIQPEVVQKRWPRADKVTPEVSANISYDLFTAPQSVSVEGSQTLFTLNGTVGGFNMIGGKNSEQLFQNNDKVQLTAVQDMYVPNQDMMIPEVTYIDASTGKPTTIKNQTIRAGEPISKEVANAINAGTIETSVIDQDGVTRKVKINSGNKDNFFDFKRYASVSSGTSRKLGLDFETGYVSTAYGSDPARKTGLILWDEFKKSSNMSSWKSADIESKMPDITNTKNAYKSNFESDSYINDLSTRGSASQYINK
jgi:hypothetical protein